MDAARRWRESLALLLACFAHALTARLTGVVGREATCWLFGARHGTGFADNARYLFEYADGRPEVRAVWLSTDRETIERVRERGHEAYHARSWRGRWLALRAGCVVVTHGIRDVSLALTGGAYVANCWHGVPLKTIGFDAEIGDRSWVVRRAQRYVAAQYDLVVSPSPMAVHPTATGLGVPRDRVRALPYPRYDALVAPEAVGRADATGETAHTAHDGDRNCGDDHDPSDARTRLAELAARGPLVFYVPTFREAGGDLGERVDFAALDRLMDRQDAHLVVKPHPNERLALPPSFDHVTALDAVDDLTAVLPFADALVTDYSSVFVDYLLLDRPQVFFAPDLEQYRADRGLYFDYESLAPGPVARDLGGLLTALEAALTDDPDAARRRALRETFLTETGDRPSATVYAAIRAGLDDGAAT